MFKLIVSLPDERDRRKRRVMVRVSFGVRVRFSLVWNLEMCMHDFKIVQHKLQIAQLHKS